MEEREVVIDKTKEKLDDCRLCFSSTNVTVHIGHNVNNNTTIVEKIHYCTSLIVCVSIYLVFYIYFYVYIKVLHLPHIFS